jgi:hypothetical protein
MLRVPISSSSKMGGPVYVSVGQLQQFNKTIGDKIDNVQTEQRYYFTDSLVEYYYYKDPIVVKVEPL